MKRVFLCFIVLALLRLPAFASCIEVQPTIISRSNAQDRVWVGTFQLVWNDFIDKYIRIPIKFREGTPLIVHELNQKLFTTSSLSEKNYYKYLGHITNNTKKNINKSIKKKFNEKSDILDNLDLTPGSDRFLIYAMLKKDFEFINEFDKLGEFPFGKNKTSEYFGVTKNTDDIVKKGVKVLFYNNPNDFAVLLNTKDKDEVYLYKNGSNKDFLSLYKDLRLKTSGFKGEKILGADDELKIPNIKLDVTKTFDELTNKRIMSTNIMISEAIETIKFNMDNKGVKLKSEAAMTFVTTALNPNKANPRLFYLDDTFVIFLKEKDKKSPYFALRVNDISKFQ